MTGLLTEEQINLAIRDRLPQLLRSDPSLGDYILTVARENFPTKVETEDRFTRMLNELAQDREEESRKWEEQDRKWHESNRRLDQVYEELRREREVQERKWEEQSRKWEAQERKWEEQSSKWEAQERKWEAQERKWEAQERKWEEQSRKWEAQDRKWEAQDRKWHESNRRLDQVYEELRREREAQERKWEEQERKWEKQNQESNRRFDEVHREIMAQAKKHDRSIGALGARWGTQSEKSFRDALAGILVESFGVEVLNVNEFDDDGEVFGEPDQVELDVIIKNGLLIICELKSSVDKPAMYTFERKVRFYEKRHQRQANRMIVVSPMIDERARRVGEKFGIEMYPDSLDVPKKGP